MQIALLGDRSSHRSHRELDALIPKLHDELEVDAHWVATDAAQDLAAYAGVWLVPGSPYADDAAVYAAVRAARESGQPFLGTCGGMQYAVVESLRNLVAIAATHAESDGVAEDNAVVPLACSLQGQARIVSPVAGTRFAGWANKPLVGMHFCSYAASPASIERLQAVGVVVGAHADDAGAEVLEWPGHPFFVTSMFQPHVGTQAGEPIHPLIRAFVQVAQFTSSSGTT